MISVSPIQLPLPGFDVLAEEASAEGYAFIDRVRREWESGENFFSAPGATLLGVFAGSELVALGGLSQDPFCPPDGTGHLRNIYVRPGWRGQGVGSRLVEALLHVARAHWSRVRLRAGNVDAARVYERQGFTLYEAPYATHILHFPSEPSSRFTAISS